MSVWEEFGRVASPKSALGAAQVSPRGAHVVCRDLQVHISRRRDSRPLWESSRRSKVVSPPPPPRFFAPRNQWVRAHARKRKLSEFYSEVSHVILGESWRKKRSMTRPTLPTIRAQTPRFFITAFGEILPWFSYLFCRRKHSWNIRFNLWIMARIHD